MDINYNYNENSDLNILEEAYNRHLLKYSENDHPIVKCIWAQYFLTGNINLFTRENDSRDVAKRVNYATALSEAQVMFMQIAVSLIRLGCIKSDNVIINAIIEKVYFDYQNNKHNCLEMSQIIMCAIEANQTNFETYRCLYSLTNPIEIVERSQAVEDIKDDLVSLLEDYCRMIYPHKKEERISIYKPKSR